ncbi:CGNR zinc finger domain-containing protein [Pseudonocardia sp. GCM10023141]|uniref:CGNR zinc finger domain-containing protein n=1 Tax=Pseudonocardia sp. GCM10023141 TaxID=3252653 RepID=UPI00361ED19F
MDASPEAHRVVAFLNSMHLPDLDDQLADERAGSWLATWLGQQGAATGAAPVGALGDLRDLREGIRQLAAAKDGGPEPDAGVLARAGDVLRASPMLVELGDERRPPGLAGSGHPDAAGHAIAALATAYLAIRAGDGWSRLKVCASPDCRWAFLDTSRNRSRRWCDMAGCGNRAKNRTFRERAQQER